MATFERVKRSAVIFLLGIFLFQSIGFSFLFSGARSIHSHSIFADIASEELETICIDKATFLYQSEIKINGEMYDIASYSIVGDKVYLRCYHDTEEKNLFSFLEYHIDKFLKDGSSHHSKHLKISKPFVVYFSPSLKCVDSLFLCMNTAIKTVFSEPFDLISPFQKVHSPPPELV